MKRYTIEPRAMALCDRHGGRHFLDDLVWVDADKVIKGAKGRLLLCKCCALEIISA